MRVLIWATTFGADLWSLARFLDQRTDTTVRIALKDPSAYFREGVAALFPLRSEIVRRGVRSLLGGDRDFHPDVTIIDNAVPLRAASRRGFVLWHGFGWKGPDDREDLKWLHRQLRLAWGDPLRPNPRFRWQCFGPWDFDHRTTVSGFHPDNCRILGSASHDYLRSPLEPSLLAPHYPFPAGNRKTLLLAPTWHYGGLFSQWGDDRKLIPAFLSHAAALGANVILRLHDSFRIDRRYRAFLDDLPRRHPHLILKYKDRNPDNYLDLQAADALITNFSSIANLFYATGRPTIHIYPAQSTETPFSKRSYTIFGVKKRTVPSITSIWKLSPEENGGLTARSFEALLEETTRALDEPECCADRSRDFLDRYMLGADGKCCERILASLSELCSSA